MNTPQYSWYYLDNNHTQNGPHSESFLKELHQNGVIGNETFVWRDGLSEWLSFEKAISFTDHKPILNSPNKTTSAQTNMPDRWLRFFGGSTHPWRRWFARFIDMNLFGNVAFIILLAFLLAFFPSFATRLTKYATDPIYDGAILLLAWLPIECVFIAMFATTPGKWIMGIEVRSRSGERLTLLSSLRRYVGMMVAGCGLGIPLIVFCTYVYSYMTLTKSGATFWDTAVSCSVTHKDRKPIHYFLAIAATIGTLLFMAFLKSKTR